MMRAAMKLLSICLAMAAAVPVLRGADMPDIIWNTNAHGYGVSSIAVSGDSLSIASCSLDRMVKVWATTSGTLVRAFVISGGGPLSVALRSDGSFVSTGDGGGQIRVWRLSDGGIQWQNSP